MKKIISICFFMVLTLFSFTFVGCGENYSANSINTLYNEVLSYVGDESGFVKAGVDENKVKQTTTWTDDKAYIFPLCYDNFITASSGLFFSVASRHEKDISYTLRDFSQEELNITYQKIKAVRDASIDVASNKSIFEGSYGNLKYRELVVSCNKLIEALNDLNSTFSPIYFSHYFVGYTENELSDGELKDVLSYSIQALSYVAYNYELVNFEFSNPYGEVTTWYNSTSQLKPLNDQLTLIIQKLKLSDLTSSMTTTTKNQIIASIQRIQNERDGYADEYSNYQKALNNVDITSYFKATNKTAYLQSISEREQSYFAIIDRFLNGRYSGMYSAVHKIVQDFL